MKVALFHWQIEVNPTSTILTIKQAFPEDSGLITCRIKNISGTTECSAELYVQGKCSSAHPLLHGRLCVKVREPGPETMHGGGGKCY